MEQVVLLSGEGAADDTFSRPREKNRSTPQGVNGRAKNPGNASKEGRGMGQMTKEWWGEFAGPSRKHWGSNAQSLKKVDTIGKKGTRGQDRSGGTLRKKRKRKKAFPPPGSGGERREGLQGST